MKPTAIEYVCRKCGGHAMGIALKPEDHKEPTPNCSDCGANDWESKGEIPVTVVRMSDLLRGIERRDSFAPSIPKDRPVS